MAATPVLHYWICLHRDQLSMSHHSQGRPPAGRPACARDLSAVNQPYHPHPILLCSLQPVGRSNYFMRLTAPQNSHSHTDRQTAQLNYIYRFIHSSIDVILNGTIWYFNTRVCVLACAMPCTSLSESCVHPNYKPDPNLNPNLNRV